MKPHPSPPENRRRIREKAQSLRERAQAAQRHAWKLQRRAQAVRAQSARLVQRVQQLQLHAAEVWDRAGWLLDVELPATFPQPDHVYIDHERRKG